MTGVSRVHIIIEAVAKQDIRDIRDYYSDKGENTSADFRAELMRIFDFFTGYP